MTTTDTIVAAATPPGEGGIGIVRLSGPQAVASLEDAFRSKGTTPAEMESHRLYLGRLFNRRDELVDEVMAVIMRAPRSYTGEDVVEVNDFRVEFEPSGCLLYMVNRDVPGVIGKVGTILGDREINIAEYNLARVSGGGHAMAIVTVDSGLDEETLQFLRSFKEMEDVRQIDL